MVYSKACYFIHLLLSFLSQLPPLRTAICNLSIIFL